jgi:glycosyltransferase involved in cell wall biosynthesis
MPAYNAERFVGEAVESVLGQTYADWQLVVVDDGSTDRTCEILGAYGDRRLRLLTIEHTGLPAVVRNRGLAASESPLVAFLDADDLWRPHKLARQVELIGSRPDIGLVHTGYEPLSEDTLEPVVAPSGPTAAGAQFERLALGNYIANSSVVLRRALLESHGSFDEDPRLRGTEDYELWLRLSTETTFGYIEEPLLVYRRHSSGLGQGEQMLLGRFVAMEKAGRLHPELVARLPLLYRRLLGQRRCLLGLEGRGRRELLEVLRRRPTDLFAWKWLAYSFLPADFLRTYGGVRGWAAGSLRRDAGKR